MYNIHFSVFPYPSVTITVTSIYMQSNDGFQHLQSGQQCYTVSAGIWEDHILPPVSAQQTDWHVMAIRWY